MSAPGAISNRHGNLWGCRKSDHYIQIKAIEQFLYLELFVSWSLATSFMEDHRPQQGHAEALPGAKLGLNPLSRQDTYWWGLKIRWNARPLFAGPPSPLLRLDIDRCIIPLFDIVLSRPPYLQFSFRSTARATVTVKTSAPQLLAKSLKNTLLVMP